MYDKDREYHDNTPFEFWFNFCRWYSRSKTLKILLNSCIKPLVIQYRILIEMLQRFFLFCGNKHTSSRSFIKYFIIRKYWSFCCSINFMKIIFFHLYQSKQHRFISTLHKVLYRYFTLLQVIEACWCADTWTRQQLLDWWYTDPITWTAFTQGELDRDSGEMCFYFILHFDSMVN